MIFVDARSFHRTYAAVTWEDERQFSCHPDGFPLGSDRPLAPPFTIPYATTSATIQSLPALPSLRIRVRRIRQEDEETEATTVALAT